MTNGFDLDHNLDLWNLKVKRDDLWPHTWPWPWIFMVKFWNSCISELEDQLTLHKGGGNRSFMTMTMTMTIWWPRSGVWIYQIVTGVTSVVGVPSTHLVFSSTPVLTVSIDVVFILPMNLIARFMGPTWGPSGAERTQVGPMLAPWTMLSEDMNDVLRKDKSAAREKYRNKPEYGF